MINKVKNFLKKHGLNDSNKTFVVGFSGGYDSMCMLDILYLSLIHISEPTRH